MKKYQDYKDKVIFPVQASYKLDGIFCVIKDGKFMSKNDKEFTSLTHLNPNDWGEGTEGELYMEDSWFELVCSSVKRKDPGEFTHYVEFIPHDSIYRKVAKDKEELETYLLDATILGYEGLVLHTNKGVLKYKPVHDEEYTVIGYTEGKGKLSNKVGRLIFAGFTASVKGTHEYLAELWSDRANLIGKVATVEYQNKTNKGKPRFPKVKGIRDYE